MKIVIDECLPKRVTQFFEKGFAYTVPQIGLSGSKDTELLNELDKRGKDKILKAVESISTGEIEHIS
jgi:predicted nuclease of predicted toxin-antitoxin system